MKSEWWEVKEERRISLCAIAAAVVVVVELSFTANVDAMLGRMSSLLPACPPVCLLLGGTLIRFIVCRCMSIEDNALA